MDVLKSGVTAINLIKAVQTAGCHCVCLVFGCEIVEAGGRARLDAFFTPAVPEASSNTNSTTSKIQQAATTSRAGSVGMSHQYGGTRHNGPPIISLVKVHMRGEMTKEAPNEEGGLITATPQEVRRQRELRIVTSQAAIEDTLLRGNPLPSLRMTSMVSLIKRMTPVEIQAKRHRISQMFLGIPIHNNPHLLYPYSFFSLTDFTPPLDPQLVEDMADLCVYYGNFGKCDVVVSEADRGGGPLVQAVSVRTQLPYVLANWYSSGEGVGANSAAQVGFSGQGSIVVNGLKPEDRCIFVDDMLSSGGTAEGVIRSIVKLGGIPIEGLFASEKLYPADPKAGAVLPHRKGKKRLNDSFPYFNVVTLCQFVAEGDRTYAHAQLIGE
jgi:adenine/guanine phosphoribosyltransferase-like PRPP-binding protein